MHNFISDVKRNRQKTPRDDPMKGDQEIKEEVTDEQATAYLHDQKVLVDQDRDVYFGKRFESSTFGSARVSVKSLSLKSPFIFTVNAYT